MRKYFLKNGNRVSGPYLLDDLKYQKINKHTCVRVNEDGEWVPVVDDPDLNFLVRIQSNYSFTGHNEANPQVSEGTPGKSRIVILAVIIFLLGIGMALAIFLGADRGL